MVAQTAAKTSATSDLWSLKNKMLKAKKVESKKAKEEEGANNTLELKDNPRKEKVDMNELASKFIDLGKTFNEMKAIFEETDEKVKNIRKNTVEGKTGLDEESCPTDMIPESDTMEEEGEEVLQDMDTMELAGKSEEEDTKDSLEIASETEEEVEGTKETLEMASETSEEGVGDTKDTCTPSQPAAPCPAAGGWDGEDPTVPAGWSTRLEPNGGSKLRKKFQDPFGKVLKTRTLAYQRLLEMDVPQEDIRIMESHLNHSSRNKVYRIVNKAGQEKEEVLKEVLKHDTTETTETHSSEKKTEEREQIQNISNNENPTEKSDPSKGWVGADSEFVLPSGWRYRWVRSKSAKSKTGFQRAIHFRTEVGFTLRSSNEAFRYMVENDFAEEDQENLRVFVQSSKLEEKKKNSIEVKTEPLASLEDSIVEQECGKIEVTNFVMEGSAETEEMEDEEAMIIKKRSKGAERSRRRRAEAKARKTQLKTEPADPIEENEDVEDNTEKELEAAEDHAKLEEAVKTPLEPLKTETKQKDSKYSWDASLPEGWLMATYTLHRTGRTMARFKAPGGAKLESRRAVLAHLEEGGAAREVLDRVRAGYRGAYAIKREGEEQEVAEREEREEMEPSVAEKEQEEAWLQVILPGEEEQGIEGSPSKRRRVEEGKEFEEATPEKETPVERKRRRARECARRRRARERQVRLEGVKQEHKEEGIESAELDRCKEKSTEVEEKKKESVEEKLQRQREAKAAWQKKYRAQIKAQKEGGLPEENPENCLENEFMEDLDYDPQVNEVSDIENAEALVISESISDAQADLENPEEIEASQGDNTDDSYDDIVDDTAAEQDHDTEVEWNGEAGASFEDTDVEKEDVTKDHSIHESVESMQSGSVSMHDESLEDEDEDYNDEDEEEESTTPRDPTHSFSSSAFDDMAKIFVSNPAVASVAAMEEVVERHGLPTEQVNWWFVKVRGRSEGLEVDALTTFLAALKAEHTTEEGLVAF